MKLIKFITIYSFIVCIILTIFGVFSASNVSQLINSLIFLPLIFYFGIKIAGSPKKNTDKPTVNSKPSVVKTKSAPLTEEKSLTTNTAPGVSDNNKRLFLKLIGSTSFSLLLMALFTKKAQASFFGSVPGPGVVSVKDSLGNKIDPAEKSPTDGYKITEIDDSGVTYYYGFVKKTGAWYIMTQDATGSYRYIKGDSDFTTNWTNRAGLTYGYFNAIFA